MRPVGLTLSPSFAAQERSALFHFGLPSTAAGFLAREPARDLWRTQERQCLTIVGVIWRKGVSPSPREPLIGMAFVMNRWVSRSSSSRVRGRSSWWVANHELAYSERVS